MLPIRHFGDKKFILILIALGIALLIPSTVWADGPTIEVISEAGGSATALDVSGDYAYVSMGDNLEIIDITDPANPDFVARFGLGTIAGDLQVVNNTVYLITGDGLYVVDVSNPQAPTQIGTLAVSSPQGLHVVGGLAYISTWTDGLRVIDISDPNNPAEVGSLAVPDFARDVQVSGNYAYLANGFDGLVIANVSNPASMSIVGTLTSVGYARSIDIKGNLAYVGTNTDGLKIVDVSNPAAPVEVGAIAVPDVIERVTVENNIAYLAARWAGLRLVNVADSTNPSEFGFYQSEIGTALDVQVVNNTAYFADGTSGLLIALDVSDSTTPTNLGSIGTSGTASDVFVNGLDAYIIDGDNSLVHLDISHPKISIQKNNYNMNGCSAEVYASNGIVYGMGSGFRIVDLKNSQGGTELAYFGCNAQGCISPAISPNDMQVVNDRAYIGTGMSLVSAGVYEGGLYIMDFSNLRNPVVMGLYNLDDSDDAINALAVNENLVYAVNNDALLIVDVSTPHNPTLLGSYNGLENFFNDELVYQDGFVYTGGNDLLIFDVSDPTNPTKISTYATSAPISDIYVKGDLAYILVQYQGLQVVDISNPANPTLQYSYPKGGGGLFEQDGLLYIASGSGGLKTLRYITENEPNNILAEAQSVKPGYKYSFNGRLSDAADVDTFQFTAQANSTYVIETANIFQSSLGIQAGGEATGITLYDSSGTEVDNDANGANGTGSSNARLLFTAAETGSYYVEVASAATWSGAYSLRILPKYDEAGADWNSDNDYEPNDTPEIANLLDVGQDKALVRNLFDYSNYVSSAGDQDYYRFTAQAGQDYTIQTRALDNQQSVGPALYLYDETGSELAKDETGDALAEIAFTPSTTKDYFLLVKSAATDSWTGRYLVQVCEGDCSQSVFLPVVLK